MAARQRCSAAGPGNCGVITNGLDFRVGGMVSPARVTPALITVSVRGLCIKSDNKLEELSLERKLELYNCPSGVGFGMDRGSNFSLLNGAIIMPIVGTITSQLLSALGVWRCKHVEGFVRDAYQKLQGKKYGEFYGVRPS